MVWFAWREFCLVGSVSTDLTIDDVDKVSCAKKEKTHNIVERVLAFFCLLMLSWCTR